MKIEGNGLSAEIIKLLQSEGLHLRRGRKGQGGAPSVDGVSVELSELQLEPQSIPKEKVEELKEAIRSGRYELNPHKISEAIIKEILGEGL